MEFQENIDEKKQPLLFGNEVLHDRDLFIPHAKREPKKIKEVLAEMLRPASRYFSPLSLVEKAQFVIRQKITELIGFSDLYSLENSLLIPAQWQVILNYLYTQGVILNPTVRFDRIFNDEPRMYSLLLQAVSVEHLTDGWLVENYDGYYSRGVSHDIDEAFSKVIGELLERFPLLLYRNKDFIRASTRDLRRKSYHFLNPVLLAGFSEEQKQKYKKYQFDMTSIFQWVRGKSLITGNDVFIPAQLVFWNYRILSEEPYLRQPITNGAGGMFSREEAILSGVYELIQRDAFFIYWFNRIPPPRIDPNSLQSVKVKEFLEDLRRCSLKVEILNITSDFKIPVFAAVLLDCSGVGPAIALGASCGLDPESAILRAITEAVGVRHWIREHDFFPPLSRSYAPFSIPLGQKERLDLWANPVMTTHMDFFFKGPMVRLEKQFSEILTFKNPQNELNYVIELFKKKGDAYEIFVYETTHPVLKTLGYHSVKLVVPALIPLYIIETNAPLGAKRIKEACRVLGYAPSEEINPLPHPFP